MGKVKYLDPQPDEVSDKVDVCLRMVYLGKRRMYIKRRQEILVALRFGDSVDFSVKDASDVEALIRKYSGDDIYIEYY
jgi:hypothetical protein